VPAVLHFNLLLCEDGPQGGDPFLPTPTGQVSPRRSELSHGFWIAYEGILPLPPHNIYQYLLLGVSIVHFVWVFQLLGGDSFPPGGSSAGRPDPRFFAAGGRRMLFFPETVKVTSAISRQPAAGHPPRFAPLHIEAVNNLRLGALHFTVPSLESR